MAMQSSLNQRFFPYLWMVFILWGTFGTMQLGIVYTWKKEIRIMCWMMLGFKMFQTSLTIPDVSLSPRPKSQQSWSIWLAANICGLQGNGWWPQGRHAWVFQPCSTIQWILMHASSLRQAYSKGWTWSTFDPLAQNFKLGVAVIFFQPYQLMWKIHFGHIDAEFNHNSYRF